jgi:hypothetical protein
MLKQQTLIEGKAKLKSQLSREPEYSHTTCWACRLCTPKKTL